MLDFTLIDGGYYNNRDFSSKLINNLLHQFSASEGSKKILAIIPTSYTLTFKSVYNLGL